MRLAVLATKEPHCLGDLLLRCAHDELHADIVSVTANHPDLRGLVERFDVPFKHVDAAGLERAAHEAMIHSALAEGDWDYLVMAKYMRILTPEFIARYDGRIVNIHHSFLPAFVGAKPYRQAHQRGVKIIGATAHFATSDLDEGPIIAQGVQPVSHAHSVADLSLAGKDVEKTVLAKALRLVIEGRVFVYRNRTILFE